MNYFDPLARSPLGGKVTGYPDLRGGLVFVAAGGASRHQFPWDRNNLGAAPGLAYQINRPHGVAHGLCALFAPSAQAAHGNPGNMGFRIDNQWVTTLDGVTPFNLLRNPYPQGFRSPAGAADGLLTQAGANLDACCATPSRPGTCSGTSASSANCRPI